MMEVSVVLTVIVLGMSIAFQVVAAFFAFRLNKLYDSRLAWSLISFAIAAMAIRRCVTLLRIVTQDSTQLPDFEETTGTVTLISAILSCLVSLLILAGVRLIQPIFETLAQAELALRSERDRLKTTLATKEAEIAIAARIQKSLLPAEGLITDYLEINGKCWPASETAGDYYDYFQLPNERLLIIVADVSGHGMGSALIMAQTRASLRAVAETTSDPGSILTRLNRLLVADEGDQFFVTMFIASLAKDGSELVYSSAGHPAYILAEQELIVLADGGIPLGIDSEQVYEAAPAIPLDDENSLFVATDGLFEATSLANEQFGLERVLQQLQSGRNTPSEELLDSLYLSASGFAQETIADDVTMLLLRTRHSAKTGRNHR